MLPDFLILGAPKCATTALHTALGTHPQVFVSPTKEPRFFSTDGRRPTFAGPDGGMENAQYVWQRDEYEVLFADAPAKVRRGESTTLYLSDLAAHRRIQELVPDARLIAVLRDPVDRAHSQWVHLRSTAMEPEASFVAACALGEERVRQGWAPHWDFLRLSRYGEQIEDLYSRFPREQILLIPYSDLCNDAENVITRVCEFLGIETGVIDEIPTVNVTADVSNSVVNGALREVLQRGSSIAYKLPGRIPETIHRTVGSSGLRLLQRRQQLRTPEARDERAALIPEFASDIALLERLTGMTFPEWLDPDTSPSRPTVEAGQRLGTWFGSIQHPTTN